MHAVATSDGTEVGSRTTRRAARARWCSPPATATPRAPSRSTPCPRASPTTSASTATTCGCSTTARAPTCRRAATQFTVDDIAMRDWPAAIAEVRRETGRRLGPGARPLHRRPHALHGDRRRAGGRALGHLLRARRPSDPHARQPPARPRAGPHRAPQGRHAHDQHRLPARLAAGPRARARDARAADQAHARQPGRPPHLLHLRRRLRPRADRREDDGAGGTGLLRREQHDVLRAHGRHGPQGRPRGRRARAGRLPLQHRPLPDADLADHRRAQPDVPAARPRGHARAAARRPTGPSSTRGT